MKHRVFFFKRLERAQVAILKCCEHILWLTRLNYYFLFACRGANNNSIDVDECDTLKNEVVGRIFISF